MIKNKLYILIISFIISLMEKYIVLSGPHVNEKKIKIS